MPLDPDKTERLLTSAARLVEKHGLRRVSVDEIAREAGIAKGSVYLAFESKEALHRALLEREVRIWREACAGWLDRSLSAAEQFATLSKRMFDHLASHPTLVDLMLGRQAEVLGAFADSLPRWRSEAARPIGELLALGVEQGDFRPSLDLEMVAMLLFELHLSTLIASGLPEEKGRERRKARWSAGVDLVLNGLRRQR